MSLNPQSHEAGTVIILVLEMRKPRIQEIKDFNENFTANQQLSWDLNPAIGL